MMLRAPTVPTRVLGLGVQPIPLHLRVSNSNRLHSTPETGLHVGALPSLPPGTFPLSEQAVLAPANRYRRPR